MNHDIEVSKVVITAINVIILLGLPFMLGWHIRRMVKTNHGSYDWMMQLIIVFLYVIAISSEIPALWSRWVAYYELKMQIPEKLYVITMWDRWLRAIFYIFFFVFTFAFTVKRVPKVISDTLV